VASAAAHGEPRGRWYAAVDLAKQAGIFVAAVTGAIGLVLLLVGVGARVAGLEFVTQAAHAAYEERQVETERERTAAALRVVEVREAAHWSELERRMDAQDRMAAEIRAEVREVKNLVIQLRGRP
jgi:hypothetical protein